MPAADGTYTFTVFVKDAAANTAQASGTVKVNSTLGFPVAVPRYFSPGGDSRRLTTSLDFRLERSARVTVKWPPGRPLSCAPSVWAHFQWAGQCGLGRSRLRGKAGAQRLLQLHGDGCKLTGHDRRAWRCSGYSFVPQVAVPASATVVHGRLARIVYRLHDPYCERLLVSIRSLSSAGKVVKTITARWLVGERHTVGFTPSARGSYRITIEARDRAMNVGRGVTVLSAS